VRLRPEFVHPGCTNIELLLWSERGLSGNEDSQHFDCATWLHEARELPKERLLCILPCHGSACLARLWFPVSFRSKRRKRSTWRELTGKVLGRKFRCKCRDNWVSLS